MDRNLLAFLVVAETENITEASRQLNITQPTLTKRIQQLEIQHGTKLIERLPRGVKLTKFGKQLLPHAMRIKHEYLQAKESIQLIESDHLENLRVGAGPLFILRYLSDALDKLMVEFPNTTVHLTADLNMRTLPMLREGRLDIVFGTSEFLDNDQILFSELTEVEQGIILRSQHPKAKSDNIEISELDGIPWIVYSDSLENEDFIRSQFAARGLPPPRFLLKTTSFLLGFQLVSKNDYAMMLPTLLEPILDSENIKMLKAIPSFGTKVAGAYTRRSSISIPIISRLIQIVSEIANPKDTPKKSPFDNQF